MQIDTEHGIVYGSVKNAPPLVCKKCCSRYAGNDTGGMTRPGLGRSSRAVASLRHMLIIENGQNKREFTRWPVFASHRLRIPPTQTNKHRRKHATIGREHFATETLFAPFIVLFGSRKWSRDTITITTWRRMIRFALSFYTKTVYLNQELVSHLTGNILTNLSLYKTQFCKIK